MNSNKLIDILFTEEISTIDKGEIEKLISDYPYFDIVRLLNLLLIKEKEPSKLSDNLSESAIYFKDRKRLYYLLNTDLRKSLIQDYKTKPASSIEKAPNISGLENSDFEKDLLDFSYSKSTVKNDVENIKPKEDSNKKLEPQVEKKNKNSLIERFLIEEPGVIPADKKTNLTGDVSKTSIQESENLLSDTLAKIYVKQGLYNKAIFAYEKLSLKYPEKSVYFASQIKEIKEIINKK